MKTWDPERVAAAAGATVIAPPPGRGGPERVTIDSRDAGPGALFVGLPGAHVDGGRLAARARGAGAGGGRLGCPDGVRARCRRPLRRPRGTASVRLAAARAPAARDRLAPRA